VRKHKARFKGLNDDSKVLGIGSLLRGKDKNTWLINVDFSGEPSQSMKFSNIPVLARKRVLNPTKHYDLAGLSTSLFIENTKKWEVAKASDCPAYNTHKYSKDRDQQCFVVLDRSRRVFIPQLEMARVLFYHDPFMARLSLQHNALAEDFILEKRSDGQPLINVREGSEYPLSYFNREDNRRFLSWVLLDEAARASFDSIKIHLIKNQYEQNNYQYWTFQFTPPPLEGVELSARGWEDSNSDSFFVWEINKLDNLPSDIEGEIDFYHPGYERKVGGKPTKGDGKKGEAPDQYDLDDDELSDSDRATMALISDQVSVSFKKPHITNRIPSKTKAVYRLIGDGQKEILNKDTDLSANEKEESGSLQSGAWNNLDDQTDDTHLYLGKFQSFLNMVEILVEKP
jgi:hypothetical protein